MRKKLTKSKNFILIWLILCVFWPAKNQILQAQNQSQKPAFLYLQTPNIATSSFEAAIFVNSGQQNVNIIQANLNFDATKLQVNKFSLSSTTCPLIIEKQIDNKDGKINIACALPSPGWQGDSWLAKIDFSPNDIGWAEIKFASSSQLLANDGRATNILDTTISKTVILK